MIIAIVYNVATGAVLNSMQTASVETINAFSASGLDLVVVDSVPDMNSVYVLDGVLTAFSESEMAAKSSLRNGFVWKMPERVVVDTRNLQAAKDQAWRAVKVARAIAEVSNFTCDGSVYQMDTRRVPGAALMGLMAKLSGAPFSIEWTLSDNTLRTLNSDEIMAVGAAQGAHVDAVFETARILRKVIDDATTVDQVDAARWPE